jgi:hypothetical protein
MKRILNASNHESPRTTKLYDQRQDEISLDEVDASRFERGLPVKTTGQRDTPPRTAQAAMPLLSSPEF